MLEYRLSYNRDPSPEFYLLRRLYYLLALEFTFTGTETTVSMFSYYSPLHLKLLQ